MDTLTKHDHYEYGIYGNHHAPTRISARVSRFEDHYRLGDAWAEGKGIIDKKQEPERAPSVVYSSQDGQQEFEVYVFVYYRQLHCLAGFDAAGS